MADVKEGLEGPRAAIRQPAAQPAPAAAQSPRAPQVDPKLELETFLEAIAQYNSFGKALQRATTMQEVGNRLAQIAEMAEHAVMNEAGDWFDQHTVKRNMKEIKSYSGDFLKLATEADQLNQRMQALYDDMGRVLERYFEIPDGVEAGNDGQAEPVGQEAQPKAGEPQKLKEAGEGNERLNEPGPATAPDPKIYHATPIPPVPEHDKSDVLTVRAIKAVHERLKRSNPEMAAKFAKLPPKKMREVVWKLVK
jgi:hypothetical protein